MIKKIVLISLISFSFPSFAEIVTHASLQQLVDHIAQEKNTADQVLIVFDLDNTLIHPKTALGSDEWFEHQMKEIAAHGTPSPQAQEDLLQLYYKIQHVIDQHVLEAMAPVFIANLKKAGFTVIALTARYRPIMERTLAQLTPLKIEFSQPLNTEFEIENFQKKPIYKQGIIFCSSNNKGLVLIEFLKQTGRKPKKIIYVDDKRHHVERVEKAAQENGIECFCVHYVGCKERVDSFDPVKAEKECAELTI